MGILSGKGPMIEGICKDAIALFSSYDIYNWYFDRLKCFDEAIEYLRKKGSPGDVILLEMQSEDDNGTDAPIEIEQDFRSIIDQAVLIYDLIIVEPAANGAEELKTSM